MVEDVPPEDPLTWLIRIAAPVADVWEAVVTPGVGSDPTAGAVEVVVPGTGPGVGAVWLSVAPFSNGRVPAVGLQVAVWEPGHLVLLRGATMESLQARVLYHLTPDGAGTHRKLQHTLETLSGQTPTNLAARRPDAVPDPIARTLRGRSFPPSRARVHVQSSDDGPPGGNLSGPAFARSPRSSDRLARRRARPAAPSVAGPST